MSTAIYVNQGGSRLVGKNQDVPYEGAYLFTNRSGIAKKAIIMPPDRPMEWVSRYGSVTVSQVGKELPNGGMNEAGLVVEQTTLWQSSYPEEPELPAIGELQWIQLMLDTCATVREVRQTAANVRIVNPLSRLHYMICDRTGECAILEFRNGELSVYTGAALPVAAMANTPYLETVRYAEDAELGRHKDGGEYERSSMERFLRAADFLRNPVAEVGFVLGVLQEVRRDDTAFSLVYDVDRLEIHFTSNRFPSRKKLRLRELDFTEENQTVVNLQQAAEAAQVPYTTDLNRRIVEAFFRDPALTAAFGWTIPEEMLSYMAAFPDTYQPVKQK